MKNQKIIIFCMLLAGLHIDAAEQYPSLASQYLLSLEQEQDAKENVKQNASLKDYQNMLSPQKRKYLEDIFYTVIEQEENIDEKNRSIKRVCFQEHNNMRVEKNHTNKEQDFTALNTLIEHLEDLPNEVEPVDELSQAIQNNFAQRQKQFEKKVYVASVYGVLQQHAISLEDFNNLENSVRQFLLSNLIKNNVEQIALQVYPQQGIKTQTIEHYNTLMGYAPKNKKNSSQKINNDFYAQAIEKVLHNNHILIKDFNELSTFRKTTLLLTLSVQDYESLPESEQKLIYNLSVKRDKFYESCKKSRSKHVVNNQMDFSESQHAEA